MNEEEWEEIQDVFNKTAMRNKELEAFSDLLIDYINTLNGYMTNVGDLVEVHADKLPPEFLHGISAIMSYVHNEVVEIRDKYRELHKDDEDEL